MAGTDTTGNIKYYRLYVILCKVMVVLCMQYYVCNTTYVVFNTTQLSRQYAVKRRAMHTLVSAIGEILSNRVRVFFP